MKRLFFLIFPILLLCLSGCSSETEETRFLMDTVCTVRTGGTDSAAAVADAFSVISDIHHSVNFFDETSTVSAFNRAPAGVAVPLDEHTAAIVQTALTVAEASDGAFDITIAPVSSLWDFSQGILPDPEEIADALPLVNYRFLIYDPQAQTLTKTVDGVAIDLGGAAKGYAADKAAEVLQSHQVSYGLINLGGNVYVFGTNPNRRDGSWEVGIQTPFADTGVYSQTHTLTQGAVVTSGVYQRFFWQDDTLYHHILNPKTGYPVTGTLAGVTVCTDSALLADCLSTACLVLDKDGAESLASRFGATLYTEPF